MPLGALPEPVLALAKRLGAEANGAGIVRFRQSGMLRGLGAARWMHFTACQWNAVADCAFVWKARVGPWGIVRVEDALIDDLAKGTVKLAGLLPLSRVAQSDALLKGEIMRYLAELPWNPDAILGNPLLGWTAIDERHLGVTATIGSVTGQITMTLDDEGLPRAISGVRPAQQGDVFVEHVWHGEFGDWRLVNGRLIAQSGQVRWILDGQPFEVWKGAIADWQRVSC